MASSMAAGGAGGGGSSSSAGVEITASDGTRVGIRVGNTLTFSPESVEAVNRRFTKFYYKDKFLSGSITGITVTYGIEGKNVHLMNAADKRAVSAARVSLEDPATAERWIASAKKNKGNATQPTPSIIVTLTLNNHTTLIFECHDNDSLTDLWNRFKFKKMIEGDDNTIERGLGLNDQNSIDDFKHNIGRFIGTYIQLGRVDTYGGGRRLRSTKRNRRNKRRSNKSRKY